MPGLPYHWRSSFGASATTTTAAAATATSCTAIATTTVAAAAAVVQMLILGVAVPLAGYLCGEFGILVESTRRFKAIELK